MIYLEVEATGVADWSSSGVSSPEAGQHINQMVIMMTTKFMILKIMIIMTTKFMVLKIMILMTAKFMISKIMILMTSKFMILNIKIMILVC